jgi:cytochrome P450
MPWVYHQVSGDLPQRLKELHDCFGEVVRTAPDELSFIDPAAWRDIYGNGRTSVFKKDMKVYPRMVENVDSILTADNDNHPRHRKLLNHAFSERALRDQEPILKKYVDQLIHRLGEMVDSGHGATVVNLVKWYNWTTFDIVGHLGFGEPFGCLEDKAYHPWVAMIFEHIKGGSYISASKRFPPLNRILRYLIPKGLMAKREAQLSLTREKVARRMRSDTKDADFLSFILRENDAKGLDQAEVEVDSSILIIAGSETTATTLSGTTYYLLQNPTALRKLQDEVRSAFQREDEIDMASVRKLPYTNACLEEGLRLFPPIPMGLARVLEGSERGEVVAGRFVPEGTRVSLTQYSAYRSPLNFKSPERFIPERWLAGNPEFASDRREVVQSFSIGPRNCIGINMGWVAFIS